LPQTNVLAVAVKIQNTLVKYAVLMDRIEYGVDVCRAVFRKMFPSTLDAKRKLSLMSYRNFQENKEEIYPARKCKTKNKTEFP